MIIRIQHLSSKCTDYYRHIPLLKGANVDHDENVSALLKIADITDIDERQSKWEAQLDSIIDNGMSVNILPNAMHLLEEHGHFIGEQNKSDPKDVMEDHAYNHNSTSDYVLAYMGGYIARKSERFTKYKVGKEVRLVTYENCVDSLKAHD